ncbi:MAG TPA: lysylphosphatidylglycerol synthase transmembrane domain-containing protein [Candidatus Cloacimonadota bacterium]|nr:lysylphosphatidylglycerol synthase transmembrane domain-containing protein [Candidatus Cloacimonadota bacterium]HOQ80570.1 lysylphosphatidylglycerol synthase transmembrane domain-containing protein [Candidatus Cloacimonadota bacterium]
MKKKNYIKLAVGVLTGIALLLFWFKWVNFDELVSYLKQVNVYLASLAFVIYVLSYFIRAYRWKILLSTNAKISQRDSFLYLMAGNFINYLIPIRAGEVAKCLFLKENHEIEFSKGFSSVFLDKLFDTLGIFVVLTLLFFLPIQLNSYLLSLIGFLLIIFMLGALILVFAAIRKDNVVKSLQKIFFFLPLRFRLKIDEFILNFIEGIAIFRNHLSLLFPAVALTLGAVFCDSLFFWLLFKSFAQSISFTYVLFGYTLIYLSYILPHPPAQIGSNELIMVLIFSIGFGLNKEMVSAVMAFSHIITGIIVITVGIVGLNYAGMKFFDFINNGDKDDTTTKQYGTT